MKPFLCTLAACLSLAATLMAQVPYSYAPATPAQEELSGLGGNKNQFVQGLVCFDPAADPALARMKGLKILGVRCYMRAAYAQARQKRSAILASSGKPSDVIRTTYTDFVEGWNDVLFDEPIVIGDEAIYLGAQAYETIGTPYPLVAYAPATVPHSCFINQGKKSWEEYTDRGTLLIAALIEDAAAPMMENTAYAQNTTHPQTVAPAADFEGGLYIHNFGSTPLNSFEIAMLGQGDEVPATRAITLPQPIGGRESAVITTLLHSGTAEGTAATWQATVSKFNGEAAQGGRPGLSTLYVTFDNFIRTPLIEEFTSQPCINCPQMAYFLEKALADYDQPYVYLAHHSGFADDVFTCDADRAITYVFGGYENEYNPAIMYNRAVLEGESTIVQGVRDMSPTPYTEALTKAAAMPAMASIDISVADDGSVNVSGRVARDLRENSLYLSCALVEDGISAVTYKQKGLTGDPDAPADLQDVFRHNGVILHSYSAAAGDLLDINDEGLFEVSYPAPAEVKGFDGTRRRIVAIVHPTDKGNLRNNTALNAAQLIVDDDATAIKGIISDSHDAKLFSGTAHDGKTDAPCTYDLSGRKIGGANCTTASGANPRSLKPGIYIRGRQKIAIAR